MQSAHCTALCRGCYPEFVKTTHPDSGAAGWAGEKGEKDMKYCVRCGGEMEDAAAVCPRCGTRTVPPVEDRPDTAMNVISFFIPLVGLILFLVCHDRQPRKAKSAGKFALIGLGLAAAVVLVLGAAAGSRLARQRAVDEAWETAERSRQEAEDAYRQSQELERAMEDFQRAMEAYRGD